MLDGGEQEVRRRLPGRCRLEDVDGEGVLGERRREVLVEGRLSPGVDGEPAQPLGDALSPGQQSSAPAFSMSGSFAGASNPSVNPNRKPVPAGSHS